MRWLIDEMLPPSTAGRLNDLGHDAVAVRDAALGGALDAEVLAFAVRESRTVVTENFGDFARLVEGRLAAQETCVPVVFVRKRDFPRGSGLGAALARHLDRWSATNPEPYPGVHWP